MSLEDLFCAVDDFCQVFLPTWHRRLLTEGTRQRRRSSRLTLSEIMTILIYFHQSQYRHFKAFYLWQVCRHGQIKFPNQLSCQRFVALIPTALMPLCIYLHIRRGEPTGIAFIDSTSLVVNDRGELLAFRITPGNVDDRQPVPDLTQGLTGKFFGDRGYLSQKLFRTLWDQGLQLTTKVRRNMHNKLMPLFDKLLLRKRGLIETINNQLKNIQQIEHTRHRSVVNAMVSVLAALTAYTHQSRKPSLNLSKNDFKLLICNT